ncbi:MAG: T9SS type A sorting domain-containing protein [Lewinellaceae bacterium]|nr:T9SS type A sorting domain-containing protein [Lewinellaceae bacterium]
MYPNPFSSRVTLEIEGWSGRELYLQLFDSQGRQVLQQRSRSGSVELHRQQLPRGMYFFRLL